MSREEWFHLIEIAILLFGVSLPILWATFRLLSVLKDFPPHRHVNGKVLYPEGYAPSVAETLQVKAS